MEISRGHVGQFKQYSFVWNPVFSQRRTANYGREGTRYVERRLVSIEAPAIHDPIAELPTADVIDRFVNYQCQDDLHRYHHRNIQLVSFLEIADMDELRGQATPRASKSKVLIDDRNNSTVTRESLAGSCRAALGPINARQLYVELLKPRTALRGSPNAERRVIYITDLDAYCALALASTASSYQVGYLRDFLHKHLAYRALIAVEVPSIGLPTFSLEFHIPYYAWRRSIPISDDANNRRLEDGMPLRRSEEVIHLEMAPQLESADDGLKDYIHEAQISVMITGLDDWFWTAYCFVDVYFKGNNHNERVEHYHNPRVPLDPLCCGKFSADRPLWNPRQYFLRTLACRMEQVKQEWSNVIFQLFREIEPCIYSFTRGEKVIGGVTDMEITQQKGFKWTIRVLRQFTHLISKTINSWETFKDGEIRYFSLPESDASAQASWGGYLASIDKDVTELRDLRASLIHQTELFENMTNSLVTHAAHAETIITRIQSEFVQALTVITILYLPATLASTIFSMPALPNSAGLREWAYTFLILAIITFFLVINLPHITRWARPVRLWQDRMWIKAYQIFVRPRAHSREDEIEMREQEHERRDSTNSNADVEANT